MTFYGGADCFLLNFLLCEFWLYIDFIACKASTSTEALYLSCLLSMVAEPILCKELLAFLGCDYEWGLLEGLGLVKNIDRGFYERSSVKFLSVFEGLILPFYFLVLL